MRMLPLILVLALAACGGYHTAPSDSQQLGYGNDEFYDGGIYDMENSRRHGTLE